MTILGDVSPVHDTTCHGHILSAVVRAVWRKLLSRAPLPSSAHLAVLPLPPWHNRAARANLAVPPSQRHLLAGPPAQKHRANFWTSFMM